MVARVSRDCEAGTELDVDSVDARGIDYDEVVDYIAWATTYSAIVPKPEDEAKVSQRYVTIKGAVPCLNIAMRKRVKERNKFSPLFCETAG
jgi:hypothetical protein